MKSEKQQLKIKNCLKGILKAPVVLVMTDNTHLFLNANYRKKTWHVRIHWMFLKAKPAMWRHLACYIATHNRDSSKIIDRYIEDHWHWVRHPLPPIRTEGKIFDLQKIFNRLNRKYFRGRLKSKITWGKSTSRRSYEYLQMGTYSTSRNLMTIHPNLDRKFIPPYVVEATIFHEMCHALVPVKAVKGRRQIHPPAFKKKEAEYSLLEKAQKWEEKHLNRLLPRFV